MFNYLLKITLERLQFILKKKDHPLTEMTTWLHLILAKINCILKKTTQLLHNITELINSLLKIITPKVLFICAKVNYLLTLLLKIMINALNFIIAKLKNFYTNIIFFEIQLPKLDNVFVEAFAKIFLLVFNFLKIKSLDFYLFSVKNLNSLFLKPQNIILFIYLFFKTRINVFFKSRNLKLFNSGFIGEVSSFQKKVQTELNNKITFVLTDLSEWREEFKIDWAFIKDRYTFYKSCYHADIKPHLVWYLFLAHEYLTDLLILAIDFLFLIGIVRRFIIIYLKACACHLFYLWNIINYYKIIYFRKWKIEFSIFLQAFFKEILTFLFVCYKNRVFLFNLIWNYKDKENKELIHMYIKNIFFKILSKIKYFLLFLSYKLLVKVKFFFYKLYFYFRIGIFLDDFLIFLDTFLIRWFVEFADCIACKIIDNTFAVLFVYIRKALQFLKFYMILPLWFSFKENFKNFWLELTTKQKPLYYTTPSLFLLKPEISSLVSIFNRIFSTSLYFYFYFSLFFYNWNNFHFYFDYLFLYIFFFLFFYHIIYSRLKLNLFINNLIFLIGNNFKLIALIHYYFFLILGLFTIMVCYFVVDFLFIDQMQELLQPGKLINKFLNLYTLQLNAYSGWFRHMLTPSHYTYLTVLDSKFGILDGYLDSDVDDDAFLYVPLFCNLIKSWFTFDLYIYQIFFLIFIIKFFVIIFINLFLSIYRPLSLLHKQVKLYFFNLFLIIKAIFSYFRNFLFDINYYKNIYIWDSYNNINSNNYIFMHKNKALFCNIDFLTYVEDSFLRFVSKIQLNINIGQDLFYNTYVFNKNFFREISNASYANFSPFHSFLFFLNLFFFSYHSIDFRNLNNNKDYILYFKYYFLSRKFLLVNFLFLWSYHWRFFVLTKIKLFYTYLFYFWDILQLDNSLFNFLFFDGDYKGYRVYSIYFTYKKKLLSYIRSERLLKKINLSDRKYYYLNNFIFFKLKTGDFSYLLYKSFNHFLFLILLIFFCDFSFNFLIENTLLFNCEVPLRDLLLWFNELMMIRLDGLRYMGSYDNVAHLLPDNFDPSLGLKHNAACDTLERFNEPCFAVTFCQLNSDCASGNCPPPPPPADTTSLAVGLKIANVSFNPYAYLPSEVAGLYDLDYSHVHDYFSDFNENCHLCRAFDNLMSITEVLLENNISLNDKDMPLTLNNLYHYLTGAPIHHFVELNETFDTFVNLEERDDIVSSCFQTHHVYIGGKEPERFSLDRDFISTSDLFALNFNNYTTADEIVTIMDNSWCMLGPLTDFWADNWQGRSANRFVTKKLSTIDNQEEWSYFTIISVNIMWSFLYIYFLLIFFFVFILLYLHLSKNFSAIIRDYINIINKDYYNCLVYFFELTFFLFFTLKLFSYMDLLFIYLIANVKIIATVYFTFYIFIYFYSFLNNYLNRSFYRFLYNFNFLVVTLKLAIALFILFILIFFYLHFFFYDNVDFTMFVFFKGYMHVFDFVIPGRCEYLIGETFLGFIHNKPFVDYAGENGDALVDMKGISGATDFLRDNPVPTLFFNIWFIKIKYVFDYWSYFFYYPIAYHFYDYILTFYWLFFSLFHMIIHTLILDILNEIIFNYFLYFFEYLLNSFFYFFTIISFDLLDSYFVVSFGTISDILSFFNLVLVELLRPFAFKLFQLIYLIIDNFLFYFFLVSKNIDFFLLLYLKIFQIFLF